MNKELCVLALTAVLSVSSCSIQSHDSVSNFAIESGSPSGEEIIRAIVTNQSVDLDVDESCVSAWSGLRGNTLGDYFSALIAATATRDFENTKLTFSAVPEIWKPTNETGWQCEVRWFNDDPEVLWSRGITYFMRARNRTVVIESIKCPGTP